MCRVLNRIFTKGVSRGIAQVKRRNVPSHGPELETWTMDPPPVLLTEPTLTEAFCFCVQTARGWKMCVDSASRCVITNRSSLPSSLLSPPPPPVRASKRTRDRRNFNFVRSDVWQQYEGPASPPIDNTLSFGSRGGGGPWRSGHWQLARTQTKNKIEPSSVLWRHVPHCPLIYSQG